MAEETGGAVAGVGGPAGPAPADPATPAGSPVESVDRALRTLEAVAAAGPGGVGLADLLAALGVHKTTVHRSLAALRHRDYVAQDPATGRYGLGLRPSGSPTAASRRTT